MEDFAPDYDTQVRHHKLPWWKHPKCSSLKPRCPQGSAQFSIPFYSTVSNSKSHTRNTIKLHADLLELPTLPHRTTRTCLAVFTDTTSSDPYVTLLW
eukprot:4669995-Amphidinium_carterae.1